MKQKLLTLCLSLALVAGFASLAQADEGQMTQEQQNQTQWRYLPRVPGLPRVPNLAPQTCWARNSHGVAFPALGYQSRRSLERQALAACHAGSFGVACHSAGCY